MAITTLIESFLKAAEAGCNAYVAHVKNDQLNQDHQDDDEIKKE